MHEMAEVLQQDAMTEAGIEGHAAMLPCSKKQQGCPVSSDLKRLEKERAEQTARIKTEFDAAHAQAVRSIDYNPNKPYALLSAGDDYHLRVWDLRKPASPLLAQKAHSHWYAPRRNSAQFCAMFRRPIHPPRRTIT